MNLPLTAATRIGLNVLALLGAAVALNLGQSIFLPFVFSALLAVILWPGASWLHRRMKLPWFLSCLAVILGVVALNVGVMSGFALAVPQIVQELPNPGNTDELKDVYKNIRRSLMSMVPGSTDRVLPTEPDDSTVFAYVLKFLQGGYVTDQFLALTRMGATWFWQSVLVLFICLFLLLEGEFLASRIKATFGESRIVQTQVAGALADMAEAIRSYLVWRTIVNCGLGVFLGLVYSLFELRQPWTWALLTAVLCYVPYIGTIIAGIPPILDALIHCNPWIALTILTLYIIVVTIEGYLIVPLVMGRSMDLNATTVMAACLFWDLVWGTAGLFLAMPLMAGIRAVCMHVEGWQPFAHLMTTETGYRLLQQEKRVAELASKIPEGDGTVVMEDGPAPGEPIHPPDLR